MWQQEFTWFFAIFHHEFRKNNPIAFEVLMVLAVATLFGFYNPKQLADFLDVPHQKFYTELKLTVRPFLRRFQRYGCQFRIGRVPAACGYYFETSPKPPE